MNICKRILSQFGVFTKTLSIDEVVSYNGRSGLKQYVCEKPIKFGMNFWIMASSDGFPFDFEVYTGKQALSDSR